MLNSIEANSLADPWLVIAAMYMLRQIRLHRQHCILIMAVFSCGIFTALASISHATFTILDSLIWMILTGNLDLYDF